MKKSKLCSLLLFLTMAFLGHNLFAETIVVSDGGDSGPNTLRQALAVASNGDVIEFLGVSTVTLTTAELEIYNKSIEINGGVNKVTITRGAGAGNFRIFKLFGVTSNTVTFSNLRITNGYHASQSGGIQNGLTLTMNNCEISGNYSNQAGGLQNDHILIMDKCLVINNLFDGGMIAGGVSVTATNSVFAGNQGYGIKATTPGTLLTLSNCLINNNIATPSEGSKLGIGLNFGAATGSTLKNCTIVSNASFGISYGANASKINIVNCIVSNNGDANINGSGSLSSSSTHNYVGTAASGGLTDGVNGNIIGGDLFLANISDSDGADNIYLTADDGLRLTSASPAFNSGTNSGVPATDILGNVRPYSAGIADMGAYEYSQAVPPATITTHPPSTAFCAGLEGSFFILTQDATIFQWQVKAPGGSFINFSNTGVYTGVNTNTLVISNVDGLANYEYRCIIDNSTNNSVTSNAAVLTIKYATTLSYDSYSIAYPVGSPIPDINPTLGGGLPQGFTISPALPAGLNLNASTGVISGTPSASVSYKTYTITVQSDCGPTTTTIAFSTSSVAQPTISSHPVSVSTCGNGSASFSITSTGTRQWQINNGSGWVNLTNSSPYSGYNSATLNVSNVSGLNGYKYRCVVSTASGVLTSNEATLTISSLLTVTSGSNSGAGTLRDLIDCSVAGDTIVFDVGVTSVLLTSAELYINKKLTIKGGASKVLVRRNSGSFRIFNIQSGANEVVLENLIIENGLASQGGGVNNGGVLTMNNSIVRNNRSNQANAIENDNVLTMNYCQILDNNGSSGGKGMVIYGSSTTANHCVFSGTGGDVMQTASGSAQIVLNNCLFVNNVGSGLNFSGAAGSSITNCTFANNTGDGVRLNSSSANMTIKNSIFDGNTGSDISSGASLGSGNSHNLVGSTNAGGLVNGVNGNRINVPALFLDNSDADGADNTWFTADDGFQLTTCSPAVDNGIVTPALLVDIVGNTRPFPGTATDMGAYEFQGFGILKITTSNIAVSESIICPSSTISLSGSCDAGVATWYDVASGGTSLGTGASFNVSPSVTTSYYVACENSTCIGMRVAAQKVTVKPNGASVPSTLTLTADIGSGSPSSAKFATDYINATNDVLANANVIYQSGKAINLNPGFETASTSVFLANTDYTTCPE